ncbi:MAG: transposase [Caldilineales bacterium]
MSSPTWTPCSSNCIARAGSKTNVYRAGVDLDGQPGRLGHWIGDGAEGANFWLSVITDLRNREVEDILIACVDGLSGLFRRHSFVFPRTQVQRCIVHQIRNSPGHIPRTQSLCH